MDTPEQDPFRSLLKVIGRGILIFALFYAFMLSVFLGTAYFGIDKNTGLVIITGAISFFMAEIIAFFSQHRTENMLIAAVIAGLSITVAIISNVYYGFIIALGCIALFLCLEFRNMRDKTILILFSQGGLVSVTYVLHDKQHVTWPIAIILYIATSVGLLFVLNIKNKVETSIFIAVNALFFALLFYFEGAFNGIG